MRSTDKSHSNPDVWSEVTFPSEVVKQELQSYISKRLTPQPTKVRADVEVTCFGYEGIDAVKDALRAAEAQLSAWPFSPTGTEGYAKAEVTAGGIATADLSSRTMAANRLPGLHAIGEAVDVTGWLGGYNFQWAWASGRAAGEAI